MTSDFQTAEMTKAIKYLLQTSCNADGDPKDMLCNKMLGEAYMRNPMTLYLVKSSIDFCINVDEDLTKPWYSSKEMHNNINRRDVDSLYKEKVVTPIFFSETKRTMEQVLEICGLNGTVGKTIGDKFQMKKSSDDSTMGP